VSLKRPTPPGTFDAPQRARTFPARLPSRPPTDLPTSVDDNQPSGCRSRSWMAFELDSAHPLSTNPRTFMADGNDHASPLPFSVLPGSQQKYPPQTFSRPLNAASQLPDLMPIMFPSEDPFAYPTQPMSALEDRHFKNDRAGPFAFEASTQASLPLNAPSLPSTSGYDPFTGPAVYSGPPGSMGVSLSTPYRTPSLRPSNPQTQPQSPPSHVSTPGSNEVMQSPDLVSIPSQGFMWPALSFQSSMMPPDQSMSEPVSGSTGTHLGIGMNAFCPVGPIMGAKTDLEDALGPGNIIVGNGVPGDDDFGVWPNLRSEDDGHLYQMQPGRFL
jgi:hypothetical protein